MEPQVPVKNRYYQRSSLQPSDNILSSKIDRRIKKVHHVSVMGSINNPAIPTWLSRAILLLALICTVWPTSKVGTEVDVYDRFRRQNLI